MTVEKDINWAKLAHQVRQDIVEMVYRAGSGHLGGSLSAVEILISLYFQALKIDPGNPCWPERDLFIMSKGHATPVYYSVLARRGYFPLSELNSFRRLNSRLQGHPDMKKTPGVDFSSGSLGQGLSIGCGQAWAIKKKAQDRQVYILLGDGEINEGQIWEAVMSAFKYGLDNLVAIIDYNQVQLDGMTGEVMPIKDLSAAFAAFGWQVSRVDGHDVAAITSCLAEKRTGGPRIILVDTVKGKGISFMEGKHEWHGKPLSRVEYEQAMAELASLQPDIRLEG